MKKKNRVNRNGLLLTYFFGKTNKILRGANRAELDTIRYIFIAYVTQHDEISRTKRKMLNWVETVLKLLIKWNVRFQRPNDRKHTQTTSYDKSKFDKEKT